MSSSNQPRTTRTTSAYYAQAGISFGVALLGLVLAVLYMPGDAWMRAFIGMSTLFLVSSSFTLAKVIRDNQEDQAIYSRLDQARVEKILAEHDPFREVA
jgi:hypothetical protein